MTTAGRLERGPLIGLLAAVGLAAFALILPAITGWDVHMRWFPPLHAIWDPRVGPGTLPAILVGALACRYAVPLADRLTWKRLLLTSYVGGAVWLFSLALVDGTDGIGEILQDRYEYLRTARVIDDVPAMLQEFVSRIDYDGLPDSIAGANWSVHIAGHPPGALLFFIVLARIGLGSGLAAGIVVTLIAASTALAVMVTMRVLGAEKVARRAAPFLVIGPAAIWQCVSADAMFAAVAAWGIAALAYAGVRRSVVWSLVAGVLLGYAVMLSYGLPLLGLLAVAVLVITRTWKPLPWSVLAALLVVLPFTLYGYYWWDALAEVHRRQWAGVAKNRPPQYWIWGNLAVLVFAAGPMIGAGLAALRQRATDVTPEAFRAVRWLVAGGVAMVLVADASQSSKGEVERIWLPFLPWILLATGLLPERWRRIGIVVQVAVALVLQHLLDTGW